MNYLRNRFLHILSILMLSSCVASCSKTTVDETAGEAHHDEETNTVELTAAQYKNAGIELGYVEQKQLSGTIRVSGILDVPPQQLISVSAPMGGFLKNTVLLEGSHVSKGQVIGTIENLDFIQIQQDYLESKTQLELTKADYERQQQLAEQNVNSGKTLQQAKTNFSTWQARYNGLVEKLKVLRINRSTLDEGHLTSSINLYAPINGYVTEVNVNIGKFVNPADVLFEIVDTEHLHAELIVFEKDILKLRIGQKVRFTLANESKERMATIYLIGREINDDRTIQIHCHIDTEDKELLPGMYLKAAVETGGAQVPALPDEAVVDFQGKKYIFITTASHHGEKENDADTQTESSGVEHHFSMMEVQTGISELGFTEVILPDVIDVKSANVAIKGAYSLLSKMKNSEEEGHAH